LNGVDVDNNLQAFRVGRKLVADPAFTAAVLADPVLGTSAQAPAEPTRRVRGIIDGIGASGELARLVEIRVPELAAYQDTAYARTYAEFVGAVRLAEEATGLGRTALSEAVARYLYKLMAYKDEYEVARLALAPDFRLGLDQTFGRGVPRQYHLQPPILRSFGWRRKLRFGSWFEPVFRMLRGARRLRGTALDVFGWHPIRRLERQLIQEYRGLIESELNELSAETYQRAVRMACLPDQIRGYEGVKLRNVERFRAAVRELRETPTPAAAATV
jgi:indolepyruvate ferredoxin oxidoreductase